MTVISAFQAECDQSKTWGCCWDGGTQCQKQDLLDDADIVYDAYYQKTGLQSCDFGGSATNSELAYNTDEIFNIR